MTLSKYFAIIATILALLALIFSLYHQDYLNTASFISSLIFFYGYFFIKIDRSYLRILLTLPVFFVALFRMLYFIFS